MLSAAGTTACMDGTGHSDSDWERVLSRDQAAHAVGRAAGALHGDVHDRGRRPSSRICEGVRPQRHRRAHRCARLRPVGRRGRLAAASQPACARARNPCASQEPLASPFSNTPVRPRNPFATPDHPASLLERMHNHSASGSPRYRSLSQVTGSQWCAANRPAVRTCQGFEQAADAEVRGPGRA